jgi:tetratricopeptide (TPR) repeat protein
MTGSGGGRRRFLFHCAIAGALASGVPAPPAAAAPEGSRTVPGAGRALGIPADGLDRVRLDDGRVIACRLEETREGTLLHFTSFTAKLAKERVFESRKFADYDPEPRNEDEKSKAAKGLVRFAGRWIPKDAADRATKAEEDAARKFREEDDFHAKWENRWQVDTARLHVEANLPRDAVDYYTGLLETFYDYFTKAFQIQLTQRERKKKLPVYLFRRRDEFRKFHDEDTGGKSENLLGYFMPAPGRERLVFFDLPGSRKETVDVMFHESTHSVIHLANPQVLASRWVHEGCAEYFGASAFDGKRFTPGLVQDGRLLGFQDMILRNQVLSMEDLMRGGNPYGTGDKPIEFEGAHYAQAWTLVHYLMEGKKGRYRNGFISFLQKMLDGKGKMVSITGSDQKYMEYEEQKASLLRSLGLKDFEGLMKELKEYAVALPLRSAEAYVERGEMTYWGRKDAAAAMKDFDTALEKGKDDPALLFRLANAYTGIPEKSAEALPLLRRSVELDPLDADHRFYLSRLLPPAEALPELETCLQVDPDHGLALGSFAWLTYLNCLQDRDRARGDAELAAVRKAIAAADRALVLDPNAHAYHALASLCLTVGEFAKAREAEKSAVEMDPERLEYLWRLAECHALLGQAEDFARILRRLELLLRRATRPAEGQTASEAAPGIEEVQAVLVERVRRMVEKCMSWELKKEAVAVADAWYSRRPPKTEDEWSYYADVVLQAGDAQHAGKIVLDGLKAYPDSRVLESLLKACASRMKDEPTGGDGK